MCIIVKIMKKTYILALLVLMLAVSGCDFFRKVAGRPTSSDIEAKRVEVMRDKEEKAVLAREQARLDSLEAETERVRIAQEKAVRDSVAALEILKQKKYMMYDLSSFKGLASGSLEHLYYIVVGSFKDESNADKVLSKVAAEPGMQPVKIYFRNKMIAVGVAPCDKIAQMPSVMDEVRTKSFCPKDAWILVNAQ
jgi:hypothetical protein